MRTIRNHRLHAAALALAVATTAFLGFAGPATAAGPPITAYDPHFFPMGLYMAGHNEAADLKKIRRAGFNLAIDYQWGDYGSGPDVVHPEAEPYLDRLSQAGLQTLWEIDWYRERPASWTCTNPAVPPRPDCQPASQARLDEQVTRYVQFLRDRPEVFGYYIADEPNLALPQIPISTLEDRYDLIRSLDPDRPMFQVFAPHPTLGATQGSKWLQYADAFDVLGVDPYPIPTSASSPLRMVYDAVVGARDAAVSGKREPHWAVIQGHARGNYLLDPAYRAPTLAELQHMTLQALVARTEGLFFYSHFDCFRSPTDPGPNDELFRTCFANLSTALENARRLLPAVIDGTEVSLPALTSHPDVKLRALSYRGRLYIVLVNLNESQSRSVLYRLPVADWQKLTSWSGRNATRLFGIDAYNKKFSLTLPPAGYEVLVVEEGGSPLHRIDLLPWDSAARGDKWFTDGPYAYTWWGNKWFEYSIYVPHSGNWNVRLYGRQQNPAKLEPGYAFDVRVDVDGQSKGSITLPGAGSFVEGVKTVYLSSGFHTVRVTWTNDRYQPPYDANLMLSRVVVEDGSAAASYRPNGAYTVQTIRCGSQPLALEGSIQQGIVRNDMTFFADGQLLNEIVDVASGAVTFSDTSWFFAESQADWRIFELGGGGNFGFGYEKFRGTMETLSQGRVRLVAPLHPLCSGQASSTLEIVLKRP